MREEAYLKTYTRPQTFREWCHSTSFTVCPPDKRSEKEKIRELINEGRRSEIIRITNPRNNDMSEENETDTTIKNHKSLLATFPDYSRSPQELADMKKRGVWHPQMDKQSENNNKDMSDTPTPMDENPNMITPNQRLQNGQSIFVAKMEILMEERTSEIRKASGELRQEIKSLKSELAAVTEQRDRLADRLRESNLQLQYLDEKYPSGTTPTCMTRNEVALQSLNQNQPTREI